MRDTAMRSLLFPMGMSFSQARLSDHQLCLGLVKLPFRREPPGILVILDETVDFGSGRDQPPPHRHVLPVLLQVLLEADALPDQGSKILRDLREQLMLLQDPGDALACRGLHIRDAVLVPQDHTNPGVRMVFLGELEHELLHLFRAVAEPAGLCRVQRLLAARLAALPGVHSCHDKENKPRAGISERTLAYPCCRGTAGGL